MCASVEHEEFKTVIILPPCHEPVTLDVTFPYSSILATEDVRTIFWWKFSISCEDGDGILKELDVQASLCAKLKILSKRSCIFNAVHNLHPKFV